MKYKIRSLVLICFMAALVFSSSVLAKTNYSLYTNKSKGFTIEYPSNWEKKENISEYAVFMALSPVESESDTFRENINVVTEAAKGYNLEKYYKANLVPMKRDLKNFKVLEEGTKTINNSKSKWIIYSHKDKDNTYKVKAYFFHNGGRNGYVITSTANPQSFKKYEPIFDDILSTFKFK